MLLLLPCLLVVPEAAGQRTHLPGQLRAAVALLDVGVTDPEAVAVMAIVLPVALLRVGHGGGEPSARFDRARGRRRCTSTASTTSTCRLCGGDAAPPIVPAGRREDDTAVVVGGVARHGEARSSRDGARGCVFQPEPSVRGARRL